MATNPPLARFARAWQAHQAVETERNRERERVDRTRQLGRSVAEVLQAATAEDRGYRLRGRGMRAAEADLRAVSPRLRTVDDPREIRNLLFVFSGRPIPDFDPALLDLCRHDDAELRRRAYPTCGQVAPPAVRAFGLAELARGVEIEGAIELLVRNFEPGDEARILTPLRMPRDDQQRHSLLMSVRDLLEANPGADASGLGLILYARTSCETCRHAAAQILLDRDAAPSWLVAECRHDNAERIRQLVAADHPPVGGTGSPGATPN